MSKILGIDLGTSNSCVSVMEGGNPRVIPSREGAPTTPSVVALTGKGERLAGRIAENQASTHPESTVFSFVRLMGRRFESLEVQQAKRVLPYELVEADNGDAHIRIGDRAYSPQEICAVLLSELKAVAEDHLGEPVTDAVITVPTYFNDSQRQATKDAGTIAGLKVQRILNASTAAALAYDRTVERTGTVAVYDLGGGTFDVSVVQFHEGACQVLSTGGDTFLGGEDIDQLIVNWSIKKFNEEYAIDLSGDRGARQRLKEAAEKAKCELSNATEAEISLSLVPAGQSETKHFRGVLERTQFGLMVAPVLDRTVEPCRRALKDADLIAGDIDRLIMVGGQSRAPMVPQVIHRAFGKEPTGDVAADELVSMGAAIQAGILQGEINDLVLLDVTPHTLGLETMGGAFTPLIGRNSPIPTRKSRIFTTVFDKQSRVELHVLQGESDKAAFDTSLGKFHLTDIAPAPTGVPQIEVSFEIDLNGIVKVSATDQATGREQNVTVGTTTGLSGEEIERLRSRFDRRRGEEQKAREQTLRDELQMLTLTVQQALEALSSVLTDQERSRIGSTLEDAQKGLAGDSRELEPCLNRLVAAADTLSEARQRRKSL